MDLLNLDDKQFSQAPRESFVDPDLYTPDPAKGQQGVYKGVGRFLPWYKDPNNSKLRKNMAVLTNPLSKDKLVIDCPSTVNKPSVLWALDKMLKDRENNKVDMDLVKEIREYFNRFLNFYSPFYIFKDPQVPALENQIKIINFGITLDRLIQKELNPEDAELNPNARKINPYSLTAGKDFLVVVKKKSKRFKDYEGCKFLPDVVPFRFIHNGDKHVVTVEELQLTAQGQDTPIAAFLKNNTPNLDKYAYREWTDDTYKQVALFLKAIIPYQGFMRELIDNTREDKMKQLLIDVTSGAFYGAQQQQAPQAQAPAPQAQTTIAPSVMTQQPTEQPAPAPAPQAQQPSGNVDLMNMNTAPQAQAPVTPAPQAQAPVTPAPQAPVTPAPQAQAPVTPAPQAEQPAPQAQQAPAPQAGVKLDENQEFDKMLQGL